MDSIGLLAAWVGVISFLLLFVLAGPAHLLAPALRRWWATTNPERARRRIEQLHADIDGGARDNHNYVASLVILFGSIIVNLIGAATVVVVSIEILDLGPAILASSLPFNINAKLLTRFTGLFLLASSYYFVFRLASLGMRLSRKISPVRPGYKRRALQEIAALRARHSLEARASAANRE